MSKIETKKMTPEEARKLGIDSWSRWECGPSTFDWCYPDTETAYVFEGDVIVTTPDGETHITGGMLVTFPAGLSCTWEVREKISKVYTFGLSEK
ncbi:MAG: cupin domain-containing protein [Candidatus Glassbacteria bacterium]|nr:cupin domain-containing protein [Candidatus Glassbacteria bacterium]